MQPGPRRLKRRSSTPGGVALRRAPLPPFFVHPPDSRTYISFLGELCKLPARHQNSSAKCSSTTYPQQDPLANPAPISRKSRFKIPARCLLPGTPSSSKKSATTRAPSVAVPRELENDSPTTASSSPRPSMMSRSNDVRQTESAGKFRIAGVRVSHSYGLSPKSHGSGVGERRNSTVSLTRSSPSRGSAAVTRPRFSSEGGIEKL